MSKTIPIDTPLAELTLRRYEKPYNLSKRDLVRKLCLSIGLLQPGDSRNVVVDVFYALLEAKKDKKKLSSAQVRDAVVKLREEINLPLFGVASSNIRRQLKRLRDLALVEKIKNYYRMAEFDSLNIIFEEKLEKHLLPSILERVKEYIKVVDENFK